MVPDPTLSVRTARSSGAWALAFLTNTSLVIGTINIEHTFRSTA